MARINFVLLMVTACSTSMAAGDTGGLVENVDADSPLENFCDVLESRADKSGNVGSLNGLSIATQSDTIFPGAPVQVSVSGARGQTDLILQARQDGDQSKESLSSHILGRWRTQNIHDVQGVVYASCFSPEDTVVYASQKGKSVENSLYWRDKTREDLSLTWMAPYDLKGIVTFSMAVRADSGWQSTLVTHNVAVQTMCNCSSGINGHTEPDTSAHVADQDTEDWFGIHLSKSRLKRAIQENDTAETDVSYLPDMTDITTAATGITGSSDITESLFLLATIVGLYISMLTVFSFLIL